MDGQAGREGVRPRSGRQWGKIAGAGLLLIALVLIGIGRFSGREADDPGLVYVIPYGASQRVPAGLRSAVDMPTRIVFSRGETAKITVINNDSVTHLAGPFLVGPGQTFVQTFPTPGVYPINCTINEDESIVVTVES